MFETGPLGDITTKKNAKLEKRSIKLVDTSCASIDLTLWGQQAISPGWTEVEHPVLALRGVKVSDFQNRSLTTVSSTGFEIRPDIPEAHQLRDWWEKEGCGLPITPLTRSFIPSGSLERKVFSQIKDERLGQLKPDGDVFLLKGTIGTISKKENITYPACQCGRKMNQIKAGQWECTKCKTFAQAPIYK